MLITLRYRMRDVNAYFMYTIESYFINKLLDLNLSYRYINSFANDVICKFLMVGNLICFIFMRYLIEYLKKYWKYQGKASIKID